MDETLRTKDENEFIAISPSYLVVYGFHTVGGLRNNIILILINIQLFFVCYFVLLNGFFVYINLVDD
jgi:hypothetical protein